MKKKLLLTGLFFIFFIGAAGAVVLTPNPLGEKAVMRAKAMGFLAYTADEAVELAFERCSGCHVDEKILKYCSRCGPPFIVVTHFMRRYIEIANTQGEDIDQFTDAEIVAITQVWNGLIGNWESDWPEKDIKKLLEQDRALIKLLETPVEKRLIELAMKNKSVGGTYQRHGLGKEKEPS